MLAGVAAIAAVFATGMIYAQLRTVAAWHGDLTVVCFLLFATAGGALLWAMIATFIAGGYDGGPAILMALVFNLAAWMAQFGWWQRLDRIGTGASTATTATGIEGSVRLLEPPHVGSNYLTHEMVFVVARRHSRTLRKLALLAGTLLPSLLLVVGLFGVGAVLVVPLAVLLQIIGVTIARWLFFAEAQHSVSLYYGAPAATG